MTSPSRPSRSMRLLASVALFVVLGAIGYGLYLVKGGKIAAAAAAAAQQPEHSETVEGALSRTRQYARATTAIGTARALRSISLRNELPGTVRTVRLETGKIVAAGDPLIELDVSVEQAELQALEAEARLADSMLARMEQAEKSQGASAADVDRARAERDKATANVARTKALIDRKIVRAPFPARVGMVDLHVGQYLDPGTMITTLQGLDDSIHVDFSVTQETASLLQLGSEIEVAFGNRESKATIVAIDARVESETRSTTIRALLTGQPQPQPGSSLRVRVPVELPHDVVVVSVSALRRGPGGDSVFVLEQGPDGKVRARTRRVQAGTVLGDEVVIRDGLAVGERVAASGSFKLFEGVLVNDATATQPQK
ncbi:MAG: efflux RND transporter periplasmic adaptor subunit [Planctomycetota bacterium]